MILEFQKDEQVLPKSTIQIEDKINKTDSANSTKLAPLFRMVSVSDEQVPGLNHLVNRPQSWIPQPRSKRPVKGILLLYKIKQFYVQ